MIFTRKLNDGWLFIHEKKTTLKKSLHVCFSLTTSPCPFTHSPSNPHPLPTIARTYVLSKTTGVRQDDDGQVNRFIVFEGGGTLGWWWADDWVGLRRDTSGGRGRQPKSKRKEKKEKRAREEGRGSARERMCNPLIVISNPLLPASLPASLSCV